MRTLVGAQGPIIQSCSVDPAPGSSFPWEGSACDANTGNGNKQTEIPIVAWTQRGGMPIRLALTHNSQASRNAELGFKWTHSFDIYLTCSGGGGGIILDGMPTTLDDGGGGGFSSGSNLTVHWGDDLAYSFTNNGFNQFEAPTGIHEALVKNVDGTFTLTKPDQTTYHFNAALTCDTITDPSGNTASIARNLAGWLTAVTDASSRQITFSYDDSNRIVGIGDPLGRSWSFSYSGNGDLASINLPAMNGTAYTYAFGYDTNHCLVDLSANRSLNSQIGP